MQISPEVTLKPKKPNPEIAREKKDQIDRVCLALQQGVSQHVQDKYGWYRGADLASLQSELTQTLARAETGRAIIVVSCHGGKDGNFMDVG